MTAVGKGQLPRGAGCVLCVSDGLWGVGFICVSSCARACDFHKSPWPSPLPVRVPCPRPVSPVGQAQEPPSTECPGSRGARCPHSCSLGQGTLVCLRPGDGGPVRSSRVARRPCTGQRLALGPPSSCLAHGVPQISSPCRDVDWGFVPAPRFTSCPCSLLEGHRLLLLPGSWHRGH